MRVMKSCRTFRHLKSLLLQNGQVCSLFCLNKTGNLQNNFKEIGKFLHSNVSRWLSPGQSMVKERRSQKFARLPSLVL